MRKSIKHPLYYAMAMLLACPSSFAANPQTIKIGYFNADTVHAGMPATIEAQKFRSDAETSLKKRVADGNQKLVDMQKQKYSKEQIEVFAKQLQSEINSEQKRLIAESQAKFDQANVVLSDAIASVAQRNNLDVIVDGVGVFFGGPEIVNHGIDVTDEVLENLKMKTDHPPTKTPTALTVTVGHFDYSAINKFFPDTIAAETARAQANQQLQQEVLAGNQRIKEATNKGIDTKQLAAQLQAELNAKQAALIKLCNDQTTLANQKIIGAVKEITTGSNIGMVLDDSKVWYGAKFVVDQGLNLTDQIAEHLHIAPQVAADLKTQKNTSSTTAFGTLPVPPARNNQTPTNSSSSTSSAVASHATANADSPVKDKWAVIIGISKFANPSYNLRFAAKDAQDFRNYLVSEAKFRSDHVLLLLDEQATRANIMRAFGSKWLPSLAEPGDLVVIYISTHGTPSGKDNGGRNYIVAHDTDANDLYATAVDMDELSKRIKEGVKTDRALIVLDTCYSGGGIPGSRSLGQHDNFDLKQISMGSGHLILSSSSPNQRSWESKNYDNGVFTNKLIEALRSGPRVDVNTAFAKLEKSVSWEVKRDYGFEQTPQMGGNWQGQKLILSLPASEPRDMVQSKLMEVMGTSAGAAGTVSGGAPRPAPVPTAKRAPVPASKQSNARR